MRPDSQGRRGLPSFDYSGSAVEALIVIDAQNEFSPTGKVPAEGYESAIEVILRRAMQLEDVKRAALLQLADMGATITPL